MNALLSPIDIMISNLFLVACYIVSAGRSPVVLTKSPALHARLESYGKVRAFAYGGEVSTTIDEAMAAYGARKVRITDFGTSIVVQALYGRKSSPADTRFVFQP